MDFQIRPVTSEEQTAYVRAMETAFGEHATDDAIEWSRAVAELDRTLAVFDGDQIVGTAGAYTFELTVPGPATLPAAGVTAVGVLPTHRRRGLLTAMMRRQLDDVAARGEPLAILGASESNIYGRYGYGIATEIARVEIERDRARLATPVPVPGRLRMVDGDEARKLLPACYDRLRRSTVGAVSRSEAWWNELLRDREHDRDGMSRRFDVAHERAPGEADGYLTYRIKRRWEAGTNRSVLSVQELYAADEQVRAALWQFAFSVDLIHTIHAWVPVDEPLRWRLVEPRRLRQVNRGDMLWVRLLDVPAALAGRRYRVEGRLVLEVEDAFRPADGGVFELRGGPDGAECRRSDSPADLRLGASELGSVYLGGLSFSVLARAGRIQEQAQGAVARADRMFGVDSAPYSSTDF